MLKLRHFVFTTLLLVVFASAETMYELAADDAQLETMMSIVETSGIHSKTGARKSPFTVFAIANAGFAAGADALQLTKWRTSKMDALRLLGRLAVVGQHEVIFIITKKIKQGCRKQTK
jgi:hypothetical protein